MHYQEHIDEIIDNFDFYRVEKVMDCLEWSLYGVGIPDVAALKKIARRLLRDAATSKSGKFRVATGGFVATKDDGSLLLEFIVEMGSSEHMSPLDNYGL